MQLLEWQNLIFLVPIALGALYSLLLAVGLAWGEQAGDASIDHDVDASLDVHADVGVDTDADVGADAGVEADAGADVAHAEVGHAEAGHEFQPSAFGALLSFLGIGRVPLSILLMSVCFVWGAAGLIGNLLLGPARVGAAVAIAAAAAVLVTGRLAALLARVIPSVETYSAPLRSLIGLNGEVLYEVTELSGVVRVVDEQHTLRDVSCRVPRGRPAVPAGRRVVLLHYDATAKAFIVQP